VKKENPEYDRFTNFLGRLIKVPHSEIKAKLEREKLVKKRNKAKQSSASREPNDRA
jgi:hypothetical protein